MIATQMTKARSALKRLLSANVFLPLVSAKRYVFCYHDVSEPGAPEHDPLYSTPPGLFRQQINALSRRLEWVDLEELLLTERPQRHLGTLTFDDGFASFRDVAWPFLCQRGIPATLFLCRLAIEHNCLPTTTGVLLNRLKRPPEEFARLLAEDDTTGGFVSPRWNEAVLGGLEGLKAIGLFDRKVFLDVEDVRSLKAQGVRFGSHSRSHRALASCDGSQLEAEIEDNRSFLQDRLQITSRHFALPFGKKAHYTAAVLEALGRHGYEYVYTTNPVYLGAATPGRPRLVPRIGVANQDPAMLLFYVNRPFFRTIDL